jgi:hypothetical protein
LTKNGELAPEAIDLLPPGVEDDLSFRLDVIDEAEIANSDDEPGSLEAENGVRPEWGLVSTENYRKSLMIRFGIERQHPLTKRHSGQAAFCEFYSLRNRQTYPPAVTALPIRRFSVRHATREAPSSSLELARDRNHPDCHALGLPKFPSQS